MDNQQPNNLYWVYYQPESDSTARWTQSQNQLWSILSQLMAHTNNLTQQVQDANRQIEELRS